jgi:hypothetical protein
MNTTLPVKMTASGPRWPAVKCVAVTRVIRSERPESGEGAKRDPRKMPNGDPPPATLWGTDS